MGIKIREKQLKSGKKSLYLDIHHNGQRDYEFLGLYLTGDTTHDRQVRRQAEIIRGKFLEKIVNNKYGIETHKTGNRSFYKYYQQTVDRNLKKGIRNHRALLNHIKKFHNGKDLLFSDISKQWAGNFRQYLIDNLSRNTASNYLTLFKAALNEAAGVDIIPDAIPDSIEAIKPQEGEDKYLEAGEIEQLRNTPCRDPEVKRAFLFACNTGLRISDIRALQWKQVSDTHIRFRQQKTKKISRVFLNPEAKKLLGERGKPDQHVFDIPEYNLWKIVRDWGKDAGLKDHLHFHRSRHTFATALSKGGADIKLVADQMRVTLDTAKRYSKTDDEMRQEAVNNIEL